MPSKVDSDTDVTKSWFMAERDLSESITNPETKVLNGSYSHIWLRAERGGGTVEIDGDPTYFELQIIAEFIKPVKKDKLSSKVMAFFGRGRK